MPPVIIRSKSIVPSMPSFVSFQCQRDRLRHFAVVFIPYYNKLRLGRFSAYLQNPTETKFTHKMQITTCRLDLYLLDWVLGQR
jgi:hypothetical protein